MQRNPEIDYCIGSRTLDISIELEQIDHKDLYITLTPGAIGYDTYDGPYEVIPMAHTMQVLETENKLMTENVLVHEIPYWETSNPQGGNTVYIGGDL